LHTAVKKIEFTAQAMLNQPMAFLIFGILELTVTWQWVFQ